MSIMIMSSLFKVPLGSSSRKILAVRLADFADDDGKGIWPSVARLAQETELSERSVQRILSDFVEEGLLRVVKKATGRPGEATRYDFDLGVLKQLAVAEPKAKTGVTMSPVQPNNETGDTMSRVTQDAETGDTECIDGCHHVTRTVIEPLDKPLSERDAREGDSSENGKAIERQFKRWHKDWPTYIHDSDDAARKAWFTLTPEQRQACSEKTKAYVDACKALSRKTFKSASSYLKDRDWEKLDDPRSDVAMPSVQNPFSRPWSALRLVELLNAPAQQMPAPTSYQRQQLAQGGAVAEQVRRERLEKYGWPRVNTMHSRAENRQGVSVPAVILSASDAFTKVHKDSELAAAWKRLHERNGWPWLPDFKWLQFPAVDESDDDLDRAVADALANFQAALPQSNEGNNHDAA